jgi:hypothetical protein
MQKKKEKKEKKENGNINKLECIISKCKKELEVGAKYIKPKMFDCMQEKCKNEKEKDRCIANKCVKNKKYTKYIDCVEKKC